MADTDVQTQINDAGDKAASAARRTGEAGTATAKRAADATADSAKAGLEAEQRTFSAATDAGRQSAAALGRAAQSSIKASQEMARHGQDMAKRATTQAADFWRSSLTPMSQFTGEFNRWVEQMWRGAAPASMQGGLPLAMLSPFTGHPLADMRETDRGFQLCIDLPGMKARDIELQIRGEMLVVSGEKTDEAKGSEGAYRFSERRFGRFERAFALPMGADRNQIEASFEDGVLKVEIPVSPDGEPAQTITVKGRN
jgi:HSP20 family molecular chaperone IbpA